MRVNRDTFVLSGRGFAPFPYHKPMNQVLLPLGEGEQVVQGLSAKNMEKQREREKKKIVNGAINWKKKGNVKSSSVQGCVSGVSQMFDRDNMNEPYILLQNSVFQLQHCVVKKVIYE